MSNIDNGPRDVGPQPIAPREGQPAGLSVIPPSSLEKRPPKLRLRNDRKKYLEEIGLSPVDLKPVMTKETSEIALQVVSLAMRWQEDVEKSDDLGARKGLASIERICRMFEHIYQARTLSQTGM